MSNRIEIERTTTVTGSRYPSPFDEPCRARVRRCLGDAAALTQFGVNLLRLPPGCWSSQRHWHTSEDEFVFVLEGEVVLVTDEGEEILHPGDCAGFPAGVANGHHLQNRSARDALVLEIGSRRPEVDEVDYSDIDMRALKGGASYVHRDDSPYA